MLRVLLSQMLNAQAEEVKMAPQKHSSLQLRLMMPERLLRRPLRTAAVQPAHHRLQLLMSRRQRRLACLTGLLGSSALKLYCQMSWHTMTAQLLKLRLRLYSLLQKGRRSLERALRITRQHKTGSQPLSATLRMSCWMKTLAVSL